MKVRFNDTNNPNCQQFIGQLGEIEYNARGGYVFKMADGRSISTSPVDRTARAMGDINDSRTKTLFFHTSSGSYYDFENIERSEKLMDGVGIRDNQFLGFNQSNDNIKTIPINTRVVDDEGYKGVVENIVENSLQYPNGLYYVSHDVDENGYKVNTDGWYIPNKLTPIKEIAQSLVNNIKDNYNKGNLELAYNCWSMLYDLYEPVKYMSEEARQKQFIELCSFTNQIEDKMVYDITDFAKDYYDESDIEVNEELEKE